MEVGAEGLRGDGWGPAGAVAKQPIRAEPAHSALQVLSPALRTAGESILSPAEERPIRRSPRQSMGGNGGRATPLAAPHSSPRLLPNPLPTLPSIPPTHPILPNSPPTTPPTPVAAGRQTAKQMYAGARRKPRHPGHKNTRIWAQHSSHPQRKTVHPSPTFHKLARVPNMVPSTFPPAPGLKEINDPLGRAV